MKNGKKSVSLIFSLLMAVIFSVPCLLNTAHSNETASREVVLGNGYKISLLSVSYDFKRTKSTWRYRVEELPSAQDLSNWMLELYDCHKVIGATPTSWWIENPDPNFHLNGIKWQGAGVQGSAEFTVTIKGNWKVGNNQVGAKGPDVAIGRLAGPSCEVYTNATVKPKKRVTRRHNFVRHEPIGSYLRD